MNTNAETITRDVCKKRSMRPLRKFVPKRFRHFLLGMAAKIGFAFGRVMPRSVGLALFSALGTMCYCILSRDRKLTVKNLRFVFGDEWDSRKIRITAKKVFQSLGKNLFDAVKLNTLNAENFDSIVTHDSLDVMEAVKAGGRGGVLVTAHLGCFEMLLHFFTRKGFGDVVIVGRAFKNRMIDETVRKMRSGPGIVYVDRSESSREIVRMLRSGKMMGVLADQDTAVEGVFADFLGHAAFTPSSAVKFAMKFKIPIVVFTSARVDGDRHHVFMSRVVEPADSGDFEKDLVATIQKINDIISDGIRKYPDQWVWMHERWKTRPQTVEPVSDSGGIDR